MTADGEPDADDEPAYPAVVRAAALLWLGQGAALLAAGAGLVAAAVAVPGPNSQADLGVFLLGIFPTCLVHGLALVSGRAAGVNPAGALSLLIAAGVGGVAATVAAVTPDPDDRLKAGVTGGLAVSLAVPAVLALAGRRQYRAWRDHHYPGGGA